VPLLEEKAWQQRLVFDYEGAKETLRKLLAVDPDQTWRWIDIGDISVTTGKLNDAIAAFREARASAERLTKTDPTNTQWQRDLSVSHNNIGDVQAAQGDAPTALTSYQASLEIRQRLAKTDPTNTQWQRDQAVSLGRVAVVEAQQGQRPEALARFRQARDIIAQLQQKSPDNATLPKDLAWYESCITALEQPPDS
jgi:tetratricopeptide (TPR) repeat protein